MPRLARVPVVHVSADSVTPCPSTGVGVGSVGYLTHPLEASALIGTVMIYLDYRAPVEIIREKVKEILEQSDKWDGKVATVQVTDFKQGSMELRCLMSARSGGQVFDLRCEVREKLIDFLQKEYPEALPRSRQISFKGDD